VKKIIKLYVFIPAFIAISLGIFEFSTRKPTGGDKRFGYVFLRTFDAPNGDWYPEVSDDKSKIVQFWYNKNGHYFLFHESKNVSYVKREIFDKRAWETK